MKELAILQTITAQTVVGDTKKINVTEILQKYYKKNIFVLHFAKNVVFAKFLM